MRLLIKILCFSVAIPALILGQTSQLRMLTINAWSGLDYKGSFKMGEYELPEIRDARMLNLIKQIKLLAPDIIFLQEVNPIKELTKRIADSLSFDEIHQVCNAGIKIGNFGIPANLKEGISILAHPKLHLEYFKSWKLSGGFGLYGDFLSINLSESNFALAGKIEINGWPVYLINVHLSANVPLDSLIKIKYDTYCAKYNINEYEYSAAEEKWRWHNLMKKQEYKELIKIIKQYSKQQHIIIAGDFNSSNRDIEHNYFIDELKLIDVDLSKNASKKYTWFPGKNGNIDYSISLKDADGNSLTGYDVISAIYDSIPRRIDFIYLNEKFKKEDIKLSKIVFDTTINNEYISDHFGVYSEINIPDELKKSYDEFYKNNDAAVEPFPIVSYDTDVGFGYGAKIFLLNLFGKRESLDLTAFNSTKGERWYRFVLSVPDFELRQGKTYPFAFDILLDYDKYIANNYFGVGNNSDQKDKESFTKEYKEIGLNISCGLSEKISCQLGLKYKSINNYNYSGSSKLLSHQSALSSSKVKYGSSALLLKYDTRDSFINPSLGMLLQADAEYVPDLHISNTSFTRYGVWLQHYYSLFYPATVFAFRGSVQTLVGNNLPVQVLIPLGGCNTLRGFPQDRFIGKTAALINAELRFPIFWRFGGITGIDAGKVWNSAGKMDLMNWRANYAVGIRYYMNTFIIRLDIGISKESTGIYFNFGHIF